MSDKQPVPTVNEVRQARAELAQMIEDALRDFTSKTSVNVERIDVGQLLFERNDGTRIINYTVEVDVSL